MREVSAPTRSIRTVASVPSETTCAACAGARYQPRVASVRPIWNVFVSVCTSTHASTLPVRALGGEHQPRARGADPRDRLVDEARQADRSASP